MNTKRMIIATIMGIVCGIICWQLASSGGMLTWYLAFSIFLSRVVLGFAIGISAWKMEWWLHGIVMGIIFSLPGAFAAMSNGFSIFIATIAMGVIYGILIELVTSVLFKAKQV